MAGHIPHELEGCFPHYFSGSNIIVHYTCNAPSEDVLSKHKIRAVGKTFGCHDNREVLKIPVGLYFSFGHKELKDIDSLKINLEKIMRDLK